MSRIITKASIISLLAVITACELVVDVDVPLPAQRLVVNGLLRPDSTFRVEVFREKHILEQESLLAFVTDADVNITDDLGNTLHLTFEPGSFGTYRAPGVPEIGRTYTITATKKDYEVARASATIPSSVNVTRIEWDSAHAIGGTGWQPLQYPIKIVFRDPKGPNFYEFAMYVESELTFSHPTTGIQVDTVISPANLTSNDPVYDERPVPATIISDTFFEDQERAIQFYVYDYGWNTDYSRQRVLRVFVVLTSYEESFYRYMTTLQLQRDVGFDPFAQPVKVYANVSGGLGIFSGAFTSVTEFKTKN